MNGISNGSVHSDASQESASPVLKKQELIAFVFMDFAREWPGISSPALGRPLFPAISRDP